MTAYHQPLPNTHKTAAWDVARILLIALALLILLDVVFFFVQREEYRQQRTDYYQSHSYYSNFPAKLKTEVERDLENSIYSEYSLSRILMVFVQQLPYTILMVYCFFFYNRYAGKYIYLLTTGICAWAACIVGIALLIGADTPLSNATEFLPIFYNIIVILYALGFGCMMLVLFLGKLLIPSQKLDSIATKLPFVLMGLQGIMLIITLCQIEEFTSSVAQSILSMLIQLLFAYSLYLLWKTESNHSSYIIARNHGADALQSDLCELARQLNNHQIDAPAYNQQKDAILKTFAHIAPPATYHAQLRPMPVQAAPAPRANKPMTPPVAAPAAPSPVPKAQVTPPAAPTVTVAPHAAQKETASPAAEPTVSAAQAPAAQAKPDAPSAAWVCSYCGTRNPAAQTACYNCKTKKSAPAAPASDSWSCPACGTKNPKHRGSCIQCGAYK